MKKIITILIVFSAIAVKSQVAIGKASVSNTSVSLEFADTENRGLILPYVTDKSGILEDGTIIYDATDHKVKYLKDKTLSQPWFDLSVDATGTIAGADIQGSDKTEISAAKISIGANETADNTHNILELTDKDKAMILPKVASPHTAIINPSAGMLVYDTTKRQLAVYNGNVWTFWKP